MKNLISLGLLLVLLVGCNPYNKISTRPPLTTKDSLHLANRCEAAFPSEGTDTLYIEGATVTDTLWLPTEIDFSDTVFAGCPNIDSIKALLQKQCRPKVITNTRVDTLRVPEDPQKIAQLELQVSDANNRADSAFTALNKLVVRSTSKDKYVWGFWLLLVLIAAVTGVWTYMKFKKP